MNIKNETNRSITIGDASIKYIEPNFGYLNQLLYEYMDLCSMRMEDR